MRGGAGGGGGGGGAGGLAAVVDTFHAHREDGSLTLQLLRLCVWGGREGGRVWVGVCVCVGGGRGGCGDHLYIIGALCITTSEGRRQCRVNSKQGGRYTVDV